MKLHMRRRRGWDGVSEWKPKRAGRAPRRSVSCTLPLEDYEQLIRLVKSQSSSVGTIVREAVQDYLGEVCEG